MKAEPNAETVSVREGEESPNQSPDPMRRAKREEKSDDSKDMRKDALEKRNRGKGRRIRDGFTSIRRKIRLKPRAPENSSQRNLSRVPVLHQMTRICLNSQNWSLMMKTVMTAPVSHSFTCFNSIDYRFVCLYIRSESGETRLSRLRQVFGFIQVFGFF